MLSGVCLYLHDMRTKAPSPSQSIEHNMELSHSVINPKIGAAARSGHMSRNPVAKYLHGQQDGVKFRLHVRGISSAPADPCKKHTKRAIPKREHRPGCAGWPWVASARPVASDKNAISWLEILAVEFLEVANIQRSVGKSISLDIVSTKTVGKAQSSCWRECSAVTNVPFTPQEHSGP